MIGQNKPYPENIYKSYFMKKIVEERYNIRKENDVM